MKLIKKYKKYPAFWFIIAVSIGMSYATALWILMVHTDIFLPVAAMAVAAFLLWIIFLWASYQASKYKER